MSSQSEEDQKLEQEQQQQYLQLLEQMRQHNPEQYAQLMKEISQQQPSGKGDDDGVDVQPDPGFVIKTVVEDIQENRKDKASSADLEFLAAKKGQKIFVNLCTSDHVEEFTERTVLDDDGNEQRGVSIPLSLGPLVTETDKKGGECVACDCVVNPGVLTDCNEDSTGSFRHFVCELALQYVERKYGLALSYEYRLPKLRYKGDTIRKQRMRAKPNRPNIQEVDGNDSSKRKNRRLRNAATVGAAQSGGALVPQSTQAPAQYTQSSADSGAPRVQKRSGTQFDIRTTEDEVKKSALYNIENVKESDMAEGGQDDIDEKLSTKLSINETSNNRKKKLIEEVEEEDGHSKSSKTDSTEAPATAKTKDIGLKEAKTRRLAPPSSNAPKSTPTTEILIPINQDDQGQDEPRLVAWKAENWDWVPINYVDPRKQDARVPHAIVVVFQLNAKQRQYAQFREKVKSQKSLTIPDTKELRLAMSEETVIIHAVGHTKYTLILPVVLSEETVNKAKNIECASVSSGSLSELCYEQAKNNRSIVGCFDTQTNRLIVGLPVDPTEAFSYEFPGM